MSLTKPQPSKFYFQTSLWKIETRHITNVSYFCSTPRLSTCHTMVKKFSKTWVWLPNKKTEIFFPNKVSTLIYLMLNQGHDPACSELKFNVKGLLGCNQQQACNNNFHNTCRLQYTNSLFKLCKQEFHIAYCTSDL